MIPTGNEFLCVGKELLTAKQYIFLSSEFDQIWNLAFVVK